MTSLKMTNWHLKMTNLAFKDDQHGTLKMTNLVRTFNLKWFLMLGKGGPKKQLQTYVLNLPY